MKIFLQVLLVLICAYPVCAQNMPPDPFDPIRNDFPSNEVRSVVDARVNLVNMRWIAEQSRQSLIFTVENLRDDFRSSVEMKAALLSQENSYNRYIAEKERVLSVVKKNMQYNVLRSMSSDIRDKIEQVQLNPVMDSNVRGFADLRLSYSSMATRMEIDALNKDVAFQNAKQQLKADAKNVQRLQSEFDKNIRRNNEFVEAKTAFSNSMVAYITSDAYLQSAYEARNIALRYSYMLHRYDQYRYTTVGYAPYWNRDLQRFRRW